MCSTAVLQQQQGATHWNLVDLKDSLTGRRERRERGREEDEDKSATSTENDLPDD